MRLITIMNGVPLYTTKKEALAWALANGVTGYHKHTYKNQKGYMGGSTHSVATRTSLAKRVTQFEENTIIPSQVNQQQQQQRPIEPTRTTRLQPTQQSPSRRTTPIRRNSGGSGY